MAAYTQRNGEDEQDFLPSLFLTQAGLETWGSLGSLGNYRLYLEVSDTLCGGNITVAQASIADITPPEGRSRRMGLIGMAFGLGFIFGPAIGGLGLKHLGATGPGWIAAGLCALNFLLALFILAESRKPNLGNTASHQSSANNPYFRNSHLFLLQLLTSPNGLYITPPNLPLR